MMPRRNIRRSFVSCLLKTISFFLWIIGGTSFLVFAITFLIPFLPSAQKVGNAAVQPALFTAQSALAESHDRTLQATNEAYVAKIKRRIEGHEQEPAYRVFKNIQIPWFRSTPAEKLIEIMDMGYSHALGVTCLHCHNDRDFSSDEKRPKRAAREMATMHYGINQQLAKMENLEPKANNRFINCATCHRGSVNPTGEALCGQSGPGDVSQ